MTLEHERAVFAGAAHWAHDLVRGIPADLWEGPGLGEWNMRALVGHTSRALLTVEQYLDRPADAEQVASAAEYYERTAAAQTATAEAVLRRGIDAGAALGADPAAAFGSVVERVTRRVAGASDETITTIAGGMRLSDYLPTRTFELVVHGLDIAGAAALPQRPPEPALGRALDLATALALRGGEGARVLLALTGRGGLDGAFSVLP